MNIELLKGEFSAVEAVEIIARMIEVKIEFHESKIERSDNEEDIKMRERRIKQLQNELYELKKSLKPGSDTLSLQSVVEITSGIQADAEPIQLISGSFTPTDAHELLGTLISHKINFHNMKDFGSTEQVGVSDAVAVKRVAELTKSKEKIEKIVEEARRTDKVLRISSVINITLE